VAFRAEHVKAVKGGRVAGAQEPRCAMTTARADRLGRKGRDRGDERSTTSGTHSHTSRSGASTAKATRHPEKSRCTKAVMLLIDASSSLGTRPSTTSTRPPAGQPRSTVATLCGADAQQGASMAGPAYPRRRIRGWGPLERRVFLHDE
jgi:hypothetical protein